MPKFRGKSTWHGIFTESLSVAVWRNRGPSFRSSVSMGNRQKGKSHRRNRNYSAVQVNNYIPSQMAHLRFKKRKTLEKARLVSCLWMTNTLIQNGVNFEKLRAGQTRIRKDVTDLDDPKLLRRKLFL